MSRNKKQSIELNDNDSLQSLMQEVYNNACNQINDSQKVINEMVASSNPQDIDEVTKIAKAKVDALKIKDSAIKIKLDVGKLQSDIIKFSGNAKAAVDNNPQIVTSDGFAKVREMIKQNAENNKNI
jgi:hypothetical protein